jgi:flagellar biosynthesis protein FlhF
VQSHSERQISGSEFENMQKEMSSIRQLLEHQMSGLMWQDMAQKDPMRAVLVNKLMAMGLNEEVADQIAGYIPANSHEKDAWQQAKHIIAEQLNTTNNDIIQRGGVVSLVGPTGVGKTTTIAKLAARFAQAHGADQVVLISTDSYRIAGFEQLATYGRIIGCQVKLANDGDELDTLLQQFSQKKLILIDTAGMGQRDMRLTEHLTTLISNARVRIRNYLVLAANTQQRVMQENVERFKRIPLAGCIYTKLDESLSVGEIITTSLQNGLAIGYLTDGQRVPEDIKVANAEKLVTLADRMANKSQRSNAVSWRTPVTAVAV